MPNFKKSNTGYMMKPKGMGQQGYAMMPIPKKKHGNPNVQGGGKSVKPPKPYSGNAKYQGEIRQAPSKATQFIRKTKAYFGPGGKGSNFGLAAGLLAPIPGKKLKMLGKAAKAFGNTAKQYSKLAGKGGSNIISAAKQVKSSFKKPKMKDVPIVGTKKTMKVPAKSDTKAVSFVNPRISMTAAERLKAGY